MYLEHFTLQEYPFNLSPDTDFYYGDPSHQDVMNMLMVALREGTGFIKVVGEVGTGKTLLCRKLINDLGEGYRIAYLPNPPTSPEELYQAVIRELEIEPPGQEISPHGMLQLITDRLLEVAAAGSNVVIILDEVQAMSGDSLEALRLLTNLETEKFRLLQVVLFGQPELDRQLAKKSLRQLRQRIVFSDRLRPLDHDTFKGYLQHRLHVAGYGGEQLFSAPAIRLLYRSSGGIPRLVNIIAHKALLVAYGKGTPQVKWSHVRRAVADTESTPLLFPVERRWSLFTWVLLMVTTVAVLLLNLGASR